MSSQNVLLLEQAKGPLVVADAPIPKPGPGQISVKVIGAALNAIDWKIQAFDLIVKKYPAILGSDIAGDVEEIGEGVQGFSKGDKGFWNHSFRLDEYCADICWPISFCQGFFVNELGGFQQYALNPAELVGKVSYLQ